jgi:hypothetical protein
MHKCAQKCPKHVFLGFLAKKPSKTPKTPKTAKIVG